MSYLKVPYLQFDPRVLLDKTILDCRPRPLTEKCLVELVTLELKLRGVVDVGSVSYTHLTLPTTSMV